VTARENTSVCVFMSITQNFIYAFGGFDKSAIGSIERVAMNFDEGIQKYPIVSTKWEKLNNYSME
jgi:hypothetical protein